MEKANYQIWSDDGKEWHITDRTNTQHKFYAWLVTDKAELNDIITDF